MRIALLQMTSGIDPKANAAILADAVRHAAASGAVMLFTPEMSGLIDQDRVRARNSVRTEQDDVVLATACRAAKENRICVHLGSLAIDLGRDDEKRANRSFLIDGRGKVAAHYDKIHLFDVDLATGESWRESSTYIGGQAVVTAESPVGRLGLSICYDLRFPALYAALSDAGATVLAVPSAFTVPTGQVHWHVLMRARAIESAAFVVAAAQTGLHEDGRTTFGHSLVVDPWGQVLLDMGSAPGIGFCDIDVTQVDAVRAQLPVIAHRRAIPPA